MAAARELPYHTAQSGAGAGMFDTAAGRLQRQLHKGEYDMFRHAPIFESDFIQITKRGEVIDVHNRVRVVTVAVASTSPALPMPDVMLLARPAAGLEDAAGRAQARGKGRKGARALELTRLLPLKFVRLSIHEREKQQLRLKFATGRSCYLQLCPPPGARDNLFAYWEKLTYLLRPPLDSRSSTYALPAGELLGAPALDEEEARAGEAEGPGRGEQDQISVRSLHGAPEVAGATSAAFSGGESIPQDAPRPVHAHYARASNASRAELHPHPAVGTVTQAAGEAPAQLGQAAAGAAKGPGGSRSSTAAAAAARTALEGPHAAQPQAGARSHPLEAGVRAVRAGPEPAGQAIGEAARGPGRAGEGCDLSTLPQEEPGYDREGRPRGPQGAAPHQGRRERREQREKERTLRGRHHRAESRHKAADKAPRKHPGGRPVPARRAPRDERKERGRGSLGGGRRGLGHTPTAKESRAAHKSARSVSTASSGSTARRLGRVGSLLRSVKASLSPRAAASPGPRDEDLPPAAGELSAEAGVAGAGTQQGPQALGSAAPQDRDMATAKAHS